MRTESLLPRAAEVPLDNQREINGQLYDFYACQCANGTRVAVSRDASILLPVPPAAPGPAPALAIAAKSSGEREFCGTRVPWRWKPFASPPPSVPWRCPLTFPFPSSRLRLQQVRFRRVSSLPLPHTVPQHQPDAVGRPPRRHPWLQSQRGAGPAVLVHLPLRHGRDGAGLLRRVGAGYR